jgi:hypothetical protein
LVAARITALRPGASPPPVPIPMQRMSDIRGLVVGRRSRHPRVGIRCERPTNDHPRSYGPGGRNERYERSYVILITGLMSRTRTLIEV